MYFPTATIASLASALLLALGPQAVRAGIAAYSDGACVGPIGRDVPCDGSCHSFAGRHSFSVDPGNGDHCVTVYRDGNCGGERFTFPNQGHGYKNVNTGTNIQSFRCSANNACV